MGDTIWHLDERGCERRIRYLDNVMGVIETGPRIPQVTMERRVQALCSRFAMTVENDPSTLDTWLTYTRNHIDSIYASYLPRNNVLPPPKPVNRAALEFLWRSLPQTDFGLQCFILCALFFTVARPSSLI